MLLNLLRAGTLGLLICVVLPTFAQCNFLFNRYDTLIIGEQGSGYMLTASSKEPFTEKSDVPWLSLTRIGHNITVTSTQSNNTLSQRIGHVIISQAGRCPEAITVVQPGKICTRVDGTQGRKFWAAFLENMNSSPTISLTFASLTAASGTITNPNTRWASSFTVPAKDIHTTHIPETQAYNTAGETVGNRAIYIETSADVSVYAGNFQNLSSDAAVILPVEALGDEYYSISFNGNKGSGGDERTPEEFLIVATENNTLVTIVPKNRTGGGKPAGNPYTIRLHKGQSYLVKSDITGHTDKESNYVSITGSYIKSNKLIAVFAGHKRAHVGCRGDMNRDHLFEQLLPLRLWGNQYLVVPTLQRQDLYRVLASHDNTQFSINGVAQPPMNKGEYRDFPIPQYRFDFIDADHPISVALFAKSSNCTGLSTGDPFMIVLNPVQNMTKELTFTPLPSGNITAHYVNITVKKQSKNLTSLVNEKTRRNIPLTFIDIPNQNYAYARVPIDVAPHSLKNEMGFTAYAYGVGNADSYGYLVGARFNHLQEPVMVRDTSYCVGELPRPLSVFDGNDLLWYRTSDFENEKGSPVAPVFTTARPDTLIYYVSHVKECSESPRKKITISISTPVANPVVSIPRSPHDSTSFCAGGRDTLMVQAANAEIFEWYRNDQRIPGISGSTLTVMDPGTYHAKARTNNFCYAVNPSNAIEVTVHDLPGAPALSNTSICKNDIPAVPAASNGYTFLWYDKNHKPVSHPALQSSTIETTTYYVKQKDNATGCEGSAATWIYTVHDLPAAPALSGASVCKSNPAPAVPSASGRYTFLWYDENDQSINEPTLQSATAETITYYIRQKDNATGCTGASATWTYIVHDLPDVKISSAASYFCEKSSVELVASGANSYKWNIGATSASLTVSAAGTYSVTGTDLNGCQNTDRVEISEKPLPYAASSLPTDTTVCHGTTLTFNVLPGAIGAVTWNVNSPVTIDKSQYLIVTATNACGSFSDSTRVTHTPLPGNPALSASHSQSSASFCHSERDTLTVQSAGATIFEWYKNNQRIPGISGSTLTVMDPGAYHAKARTNNFCYAVNPSNAIKVTVHDLPDAPALSNTSICKNDIPAVPAASNGYTFLWYDKNHKPVSHPALQSSTIETTTYYVKQKNNATGCESSAATWIYTVQDLPGITISGTPWFCTNSHTKLTAAGAVDYLWNTGVASASVSINAVDTYSVTGTDHNGCKNTAQITVVERPLPAVVANNDTTVCYEREVTLGTRHHIGALRWNSPLTVKVTGPQTYTVTASNECGAASDEMTVDIFAPLQFTVQNPLPPYTHKRFYEQKLSFENADRPVYLRWLGSLPDGMTITPDGILRGTPMTADYNFNSHRFTLFLEDYRGCATAQEFLLPARFSAPNTIIRDGGENSHFLPDFEVEIYSRQGILIHKGKGWLGTSGSSQVPPGTYFYKVNVMQDGEQHQHMGYVTVLQ